jgi:hypothetical protein
MSREPSRVTSEQHIKIDFGRPPESRGNFSIHMQDFSCNSDEFVKYTKALMSILT